MSRWLHLLGWLLALGLVALPVIAVVQGWIGGERWPIRTLSVSAPFRAVEESQIRAVVVRHLDGGFFAVEPSRIRDDLAGLPWVAEVRVRKRWPDRLEVRLSEHRPLAAWGDEHLLSDDGVLFATPANPPEGLPRFNGPESRASDVVAFYQQARRVLAVAGEDVDQVNLSPRGSWQLALSSGLSIEVGRDATADRLARFARFLPGLAAERATRVLQAADLRYTNGFALRWAEPGALNESQG